jgi:hypothetical protein
MKICKVATDLPFPIADGVDFFQNANIMYFELPRMEQLIIQWGVDLKSRQMKLDIRKYYQDNDGNYRPTAKGIRLSDEMAASFVLACMRVMEAPDVADLVAHDDVHNAWKED